MSVLMALDPLEREHLRRKMAQKMAIFQESASTVHCVSAHYSEEPKACELCQESHANEVFVIKNRSGKKLHVALSCLKEMIRFRVTDVEDLTKWLPKLPELKAEQERRKAELAVQREREREEARQRLGRKVIVRKRDPEL